MQEKTAGVDLSLIDYTLALTPEERIRANDRAVACILELRAGFAEILAGATPVLVEGGEVDGSRD